MSQLMLNGEPIAGGGLSVVQMTEAQYLANKTALDSSDILVMITDVDPSVADGESVVYNSDMNFEDIGNIATKAIAKVEPSDTALYLHEVGTGFINKDGNYCITDVQIPVNGTITLGTNCHVVDGGISSELAYKIQCSNFTINVGSMSADATTIGGYRSRVVITNSVDPNFDSSVIATVVLYASTTGAPNRSLMAFSQSSSVISINSANDISNQTVDIQVLYIR